DVERVGHLAAGLGHRDAGRGRLSADEVGEQARLRRLDHHLDTVAVRARVARAGDLAHDVHDDGRVRPPELDPAQRHRPILPGRGRWRWGARQYSPPVSPAAAAVTSSIAYL